MIQLTVMSDRSKYQLIVFCLFLMYDVSLAYKILIIPVYQRSHVSSLMTIADELDRRGHEVHILGFEGLHGISLKSSVNGSNVKEFQMRVNETAGKSYEINEIMQQLSLEFIKSQGNHKRMVEKLESSPFNVCNRIQQMAEESFDKLASEHFELVIVDGNLYSTCFYLIPHRLGIPWMTYSDFLDPWLVRLPYLPSFVPNHFTTFTDRMSFSQRCRNTLVVTYARLFGKKFTVPDQVLTSYRQYGSFASLDELASRSLIFLVTSHVILDYPKPSFPNVFQVGGLTTSEPKALPPEMKQFLDGAESGVILISFGSMLATFPEEITDKFSAALSRLTSHRVIWRLANSNDLKLSNNVMAADWIPQNDVLAHPNTKLFITHCGNNGQFEAIYNKVPMIGFPFFGDQTYNAVRIQHKGYGLMMNINEFTSDELLNNINKIISDPSYAQQLSLASEIFKSSRERPAEIAASAVEHVCRFGGDHIRSAGNDLSLSQYLMLDLLAALVFIIVTCLITVYKVVHIVYVKYRLFNTRRVEFAEQSIRKNK